MEAPKLATFCFHAEGMRNERYHEFISRFAEEFSTSPAPSKRFILDEFGLDEVGGQEGDLLLDSSHIRGFQLLEQFPFTQSLEFRRCIFGFTST